MLAESSNDGNPQKLIGEENRTFFCSELVVKALKVCKLLNQELDAVSTKNFLPPHLSSKSTKLRLRDGIKIGNDMSVITKQHFEFEQSEIQSKANQK